MTSQLKYWKSYKAQLITCDVIMKNNDKVRDVRSLVLDGCVPGTWNPTILRGGEFG